MRSRDRARGGERDFWVARMGTASPCAALALAVASCLLALACGEVHLPSIGISTTGKADRATKGRGHDICHDPSLRDLPHRVGLVRDLRNRDALKTLRTKHAVKFGTCAVVGNAGNLQATQYGKVIDSHDLVFRLNQAPTKGYSKLVGSRATFRLINKEWVTEYAKDLKWLPREVGLVLLTRGDNEVRMGRNKYTHILGVPSVQKDVERWSRKSKVAVMQFNKSLAAAAWKKITSFQKCTGSDKKCDRCKVRPTDRAATTKSILSMIRLTPTPPLAPSPSLDADRDLQATSGMLAIISSLILCDKVSVYGMGGSRFAGDFPYQ